jgi:hypothetical protein
MLIRLDLFYILLVRDPVEQISFWLKDSVYDFKVAL